MEHSLAHPSSKSLWPRGGRNHMIHGARIPLLGWETGRIDLERRLGREGQKAWRWVQVSTILQAWALRKRKCFHNDPAWALNFTFIVSSLTRQLPSAHLCSRCLPAWLFSIDSNPTYPSEFSSPHFLPEPFLNHSSPLISPSSSPLILFSEFCFCGN